MNHYIDALKKFAIFSGRASRANYWYFVLFNFLILIVLAVLSAVMENQLLYMIYNIAMLIPSISVGVRRMHDVNKSGWFILIPIYNLILTLTEGTHGPNEYGDDPYGQDDLNQLVEN